MNNLFHRSIVHICGKYTKKKVKKLLCSSFFRTFAAEYMKLANKRHMAAWMLLAVFVPILLLSSIHIHETGETTTTECNDCVHHSCHGHLSSVASWDPVPDVDYVGSRCDGCYVICSCMYQELCPALVRFSHQQLWQHRNPRSSNTLITSDYLHTYI